MQAVVYYPSIDSRTVGVKSHGVQQTQVSGGSLRFCRPHLAIVAIKGMSFDPSGVRLYSTFGTKLACAVRSIKPHFTSTFSSRLNTRSAIVVVPAELTVRFNSPYRRGLSLSSQAILNLCLPIVSL
jgi:hypothetical protein